MSSLQVHQSYDVAATTTTVTGTSTIAGTLNIGRWSITMQTEILQHLEQLIFQMDGTGRLNYPQLEQVYPVTRNIR